MNRSAAHQQQITTKTYQMFYSFFLFFPEAFLLVGETFTVQLTDVRLLSPLVGSTPRILEANVVIATVPEEAANSEVTCPACFQLFQFIYLFLTIAS